jgi:FixJ family two-component response regulator
MSPNSPTVFVIDDDPSFLRSMVRLLRSAGIPVVAYDSAKAFLENLSPTTAGCVVTDLRMPEIDGLALQAALDTTGNPLPIIFLTGHGDIPTSVHAMRRGAEDFLTKTAPGTEVFAAIERALARDQMLRAQRTQRDAARGKFNSLTEREHEVLSHVLQGKLNKQIAADLGIHERTVKLHRTAVTRKLGARSVVELARLSHDAGMHQASIDATRQIGPTFP